MKIIENGGVCSAKGFTAAGICCGIRKGKDKSDLALIVSEKRAHAAAVYTKNLVKGAPLIVTKDNISDGFAQAVIVNSGNANTCNANGVEIAEKMCALVEEHTGVSAKDVIVASTGVIGQPLSIEPIAGGMAKLVNALEADGAKAAEAIMTTDLAKKEIAVEFEVNGVKCVIGGMAKGSGMIHPDMATMLAFITTDAAVTSAMLQKALSADVNKSFNMVSVDGDTSTNDMVSLMANGMAGNTVINAPGAGFDAFCEALGTVTMYLCRQIARDGEGATKLIMCEVSGAKTEDDAVKIAKAVICSSLVKAAMFGADANWGRVLCAIGYSGADVDVDKVDVAFSSVAGTVEVCADGAGVAFSEEKASEILKKDEVIVHVELKSGGFTAKAFGCDLTYDYVKINGDYRT